MKKVLVILALLLATPAFAAENTDVLPTVTPVPCEAGFMVNPATKKCENVVSPMPAQMAGDMIYHPKAETLSCTANDDCRVISGICNRPTAVNKENMFSFMAAANKVRMTTPCTTDKTDYSKVISAPICENKQCVLHQSAGFESLSGRH